MEENISWDLNQIGFIVGVLGLFISFVSLVYTIYIQNQSKKKEKEYDYLLGLARLNIDKNVNEKELLALRSQIDNLYQKLQKDIPNQAKRAILNKRNEEIKKIIIDNLQELEKLKNDLKDSDEIEPLPINILHKIETEIAPFYEQKQRLNTSQNILIVILTLAILSSLLIPITPANMYAGIGFLILSFPYVVKVFKEHFIVIDEKYRIEYYKALKTVLTLFIVFSFFGAVLMTYLGVARPDKIVLAPFMIVNIFLYAIGAFMGFALVRINKIINTNRS